MVYNDQVAEMIDAFRRLPAAGPKSAPKMVYYLLNRPDEEVFRFAESIIEAKKKIKYCRKCCTITDREVCPICSSSKRDGTVIMVVETPREIDVYEKTKKYNGLYHVLNGLICPSRGVTDKDIRLKELVVRPCPSRTGKSSFPWISARMASIPQGTSQTWSSLPTSG